MYIGKILIQKIIIIQNIKAGDGGIYNTSGIDWYKYLIFKDEEGNLVGQRIVDLRNARQRYTETTLSDASDVPRIGAEDIAKLNPIDRVYSPISFPRLAAYKKTGSKRNIHLLGSPIFEEIDQRTLSKTIGNRVTGAPEYERKQISNPITDEIRQGIAKVKQQAQETYNNFPNTDWKPAPGHPFWEFQERYPGGELPEEFRPESDPNVVGLFYGYDKDTNEGYLRTRTADYHHISAPSNSLANEQNQAIYEIKRRLLNLKKLTKTSRGSYDVRWDDIAWWINDLDNLVSSTGYLGTGNVYKDTSIFTKKSNHFSTQQKRDIVNAAHTFWINEIIQPQQWTKELEVKPIAPIENEDTDFDPIFYKNELKRLAPNEIFNDEGEEVWASALANQDWHTILRYTSLPAVQVLNFITLAGREQTKKDNQEPYNQETIDAAVDILNEGESNYWKAHYRKYGMLSGIRAYEGEIPESEQGYLKLIQPTDHEYQLLRNLSLGVLDEAQQLGLEQDSDFYNNTITNALHQEFLIAENKEEKLTEILESLKLNAEDIEKIVNDEDDIYDLDEIKNIIKENVDNLDTDKRNEYLALTGDLFREAEALKYLSGREILENKKFDALFKDARNETINKLEQIRRQELEYDTLMNIGGLKDTGIFDLGKTLANNLLGDGMGMVMSFGGDTSLEQLKDDWADKFQTMAGISNNVTFNWQKWFDETLSTKYAEVEAEEFTLSIQAKAFSEVLQQEKELSKTRINNSLAINEEFGIVYEDILDKVNQRALEIVTEIEKERGDLIPLVDEGEDVFFSQEFIDNLKENIQLDNTEKIDAFFDTTEGSYIKEVLEKQDTPFRAPASSDLFRLRQIARSFVDPDREQRFRYHSGDKVYRYFKQPWQLHTDGVTKLVTSDFARRSGFQTTKEFYDFFRRILNNPYDITFENRKEITGTTSMKNWARIEMNGRSWESLNKQEQEAVQLSWLKQNRLSESEDRPTLSSIAQEIYDLATGKKFLSTTSRVDERYIYQSLPLEWLDEVYTAINKDSKINPGRLYTENDLNNPGLLPGKLIKDVSREIEDEEGNIITINRTGYSNEDEEELDNLTTDFNTIYNDLYSSVKKGLSLPGSDNEEVKIEYDFANEFINEYLKPRFDYSKSMEEFVSYMDIQDDEQNIFQTINRLEEVKLAAAESAKQQFKNIIEADPETGEFIYQKEFNSNYYLSPYDHIFPPGYLTNKTQIEEWQKNRQEQNRYQKTLVLEDLNRAIEDPTSLVDPDNPALGTWLENLYYYGYINKLDDETINTAIQDLDKFARLHYQLIGSKGVPMKDEQGNNLLDENGNIRLFHLSGSENPQNIASAMLRTAVQSKAESIPTVFGTFVKPEDAIEYLLGGVDPSADPNAWKELLDNFGLASDTTFEELSKYAAEILRTAEAAEIRDTIKLLNKKELRPTQARLGATYIERPEDEGVDEEDFTEIYKVFQNSGYKGSQEEFFDTFLEGESMEDLQVLDKVLGGKIPEFDLDISDPFTALTKVENIFDDEDDDFDEDEEISEDNLFDLSFEDDDDDDDDSIESTFGNMAGLFSWS